MTELYESARFQNKSSLSIALFRNGVIRLEQFHTLRRLAKLSRWIRYVEYKNGKSLSRPFIGNIDTDKACMIQVLELLCDIKDKPEDHGITCEDNIRGVQVAHHTFVERLKA